MEKEKNNELLSPTTVEEELDKKHSYGSGYRSCSWFIVIGEKAMHDLNLTYETLPDFIQENFSILYACWDEEKSDKGKTHLHLYMELDNKVRFSTMLKKLPGAHLDRRYGSPSEARLYIQKPEGVLFKGKEKSHTVTKPMQELGNFEPFKHMKGYRKESEWKMSTQDKMDYALEHFNSWEEVITWDIHFATTNKSSLLSAFEQKRYNDFINSDICTKYTNMYGKTSISVNRKVYYLCGSAGCGKTEGVKRKYGEDDVSKITNLKADMKFDDYNNNGVLLFDEFYSQIPLNQMLNLLDNKITKLPCRYENKHNLSHTIILTSNNAFEQQYPNAKTENPETYHAFCRRFNCGIWEMYQASANSTENLLPTYLHTGTRYIAMKSGPIDVEPPVDVSDNSVVVISYASLQAIKSINKLDFSKRKYVQVNDILVPF